MVTTSNIEPRQVAFSDPAHVIRPNLVYGGVAVAGAGVGAVGGKIDMKHGVTAATEAVGAATRWARRQHHQCVFYRQLLKGARRTPWCPTLVVVRHVVDRGVCVFVESEKSHSNRSIV